jgi:hypothetical protein
MDGKKVDTLTLFTRLGTQPFRAGKKGNSEHFPISLASSAAQARNGFDETNIHGVGARPNDAAPVAIPS